MTPLTAPEPPAALVEPGVLYSSDLGCSKCGLELVGRGKVRDLYRHRAGRAEGAGPSSPQDQGPSASGLLIVATDRISCFDQVLATPVPGKGRLLTLLSGFWFRLLADHCPSHFLDLSSAPSCCAERRAVESSGAESDHSSSRQPEKTSDKASDKPSDENFASPSANTSVQPVPPPPVYQDRCMLVKPARVLPIESIVRGYLTGSAWREYSASGTVHGIPLPAGLVESQKLDTPLWTPSTKAGPGDHDENISPEKAAELIGPELARRVAETSIKLYEVARDYAAQRGVLIADTKFEFGLDESASSGGELMLIDEVLTPDSSRFWDLATYCPGSPQESMDKEILRRYLASNNLKGKPNVAIPHEVLEATRQAYQHVYRLLTVTTTAPPE